MKLCIEIVSTGSAREAKLSLRQTHHIWYKNSANLLGSQLSLRIAKLPVIIRSCVGSLGGMLELL
jgi:hypothetical protein